jgi:quinoprotein glucose dehydrogenase
MRLKSLRLVLWLTPIFAVIAMGFTPRVQGQRGAPPSGEWRVWGADGGNSHYSPLDQINATNVKDLKLTWRWKSENMGPRIDSDWKTTPLMIGGVLYFTAGSRRDVVAADAKTGETLWLYRFDEGTRGTRAPNRGPSGRGLTYWTDGRGDERLIYVSLGYQLIELNPKTGRPLDAFGKNGVVDLWEGLDQGAKVPKEGDMSLTSPPPVVRDVIVIGAALGGGRTKEFIAGFPRGFDVRTGKRLWTFHTIPRPGEFGNETWEGDSWSYTGHTGAWSQMAVDEELGYVYIPVETPTNDVYGGHRPGANLFGNTILCLDAKTGKRIWHFQTTHHDIWDYDLPAAANLLDVTIDGRPRKILAQVTKQGFTFVLDRVTGQPIWPIVERPVPQSDVPGEKTSPTQPIPTKPVAFERQGMTDDDLVDFTPELKAEAREIAKKYRMGPVYTPGSDKQSVWIMPNPNGGASWQGAAFDPETGILYVGSASTPRIITLEHDPKRSNMDFTGSLRHLPALYPHGINIVKPPWGRITAIDLNTGDNVFVVPNGDTPDAIKNNPALKGVNLPRTGTADASGLLVTKTLLFSGTPGTHPSIPQGQGAPFLLALNKKTGDVIYQLHLPDDLRPTGVPMTYMVNGNQYIVFAAGIQPPATRETKAGELIAFSLVGPQVAAAAIEQ